MRSIRSDILSLLGARGVGVIIPLLATPYLARVLEPAGFGMYATGLGIGAIISTIVKFGFDSSSFKDGAAISPISAEFRSIVSETYMARFALWFFVGIALVLSSLFLALSYDWSTIMWVAFVFTLPNALYPQWALQALGKFRTSAVINIFSRMIALALTFVFVRGPGDSALALALNFGWSIPAMIVAQLVIRKAMGGHRLDLPRPKQVLLRPKSSAPFFVSVAYGSVYTVLNVPLLGLLGVGSTSVGYFAASEQIVGAARIPADPIKQVYFGRLSREHATRPSESQGLRRSCLLLLVAVFIVIISFGLLLAPWIVDIFLGDGYEAVRPLLYIGLVAIIPWVFNQWAETVMQTSGRVRRSMVAPIFGAIGHLLYIGPMVSAWGAMGMALAVCTTQIVISSVLAVQMLRRES